MAKIAVQDPSRFVQKQLIRDVATAPERLIPALLQRLRPGSSLRCAPARRLLKAPRSAARWQSFRRVEPRPRFSVRPTGREHRSVLGLYTQPLEGARRTIWERRVVERRFRAFSTSSPSTAKSRGTTSWWRRNRKTSTATLAQAAQEPGSGTIERPFRERGTPPRFFPRKRFRDVLRLLCLTPSQKRSCASSAATQRMDLYTSIHFSSVVLQVV